MYFYFVFFNSSFSYNIIGSVGPTGRTRASPHLSLKLLLSIFKRIISSSLILYLFFPLT